MNAAPEKAEPFGRKTKLCIANPKWVWAAAIRDGAFGKVRPGGGEGKTDGIVTGDFVAGNWRQSREVRKLRLDVHVTKYTERSKDIVWLKKRACRFERERNTSIVLWF